VCGIKVWVCVFCLVGVCVSSRFCVCVLGMCVCVCLDVRAWGLGVGVGVGGVCMFGMSVDVR
jgi:hypothetical protein